MKLEVLTATMHQRDFSKIEEMNIRCDVVFANQADRHGYEEMRFPYGTAKMVTTPYCGVGRNRNLALLHASGDILLFSDDDMVYQEDYAAGVLQAFTELPEADVIVFETVFEKAGQVVGAHRHRTGKLSFLKCWKYGTYAIAVRKAALDGANIWFHTEFGGGCRYLAGEDSLFLTDCYRKGLRVYAYSYVLGRCKKDTSSWFTGFDGRYYHDKGAWLACALPGLCRIAAPLLAVKWRKQDTQLRLGEVIRQMQRGIRDYKRAKHG